MALNDGFEYREQIICCGTSMTALEYLSRRYRHSSEGEWRRRFERGEVFLSGTLARPDDILRSGQILVWKRPPWNEPEVPLSCAVLYEDEDLLAVAKPRGLPTVPAGGFLSHTLLKRVRKAYPSATPVHRLGRGTSGVVLFALTPFARSALAAMFRNGEVAKTYRALADGSLNEDSLTVAVPIGPVPHPKLGTVHGASSAGKTALSRVRVLEDRGTCSLVEVQIDTGRPHQIRIHMAAIGHPLVGDPLYAPGGRLVDDGVALPGDTGYWLHAERLSLDHPASRVLVEIHCISPPQLRCENVRRQRGVRATQP